MRYRKKAVSANRADGAPESPEAAAIPVPTYVVGAGRFARELVRLVREHSELALAGILDPDVSRVGQVLDGCPVVGWLGEINELTEAAAVIGTAAVPDGFDRQAVYHILVKRGLGLPILCSASSQCARDVDLRRGTVLLPNAVVRSGAAIGYNCLIGAGARIGAGSRVDDHRVVMSGQSMEDSAVDASPRVEPRSLAAVIASEKDSIQEVIRKIDFAAMEIMLIADSHGVLVGTITDGDVRRGILAGVDLHQPASTIMNRHPITVREGASRESMMELMRSRSIRHVPVVNAAGRPVRLEVIDRILFPPGRQEAVVMAGGQGNRLRPLTESTPKPLLAVGGRPILDHILEGLRSSGLEDVAISVNYLGDRIREHVGTGGRHRMNVSYLTEKDRLGTAGALSLLNPKPRKPFLVMNGDLLTDVNFKRLLEFQAEGGYRIAMCVRHMKITIPYGVAETRVDRVVCVREKPEMGFFINAGIYVVDPSCLSHIPRAGFMDMPDLIDRVIQSGGAVGAFPIYEYWRDIGTAADLAAATAERHDGATAESRKPRMTTTISVEAAG
jgi:NDP-sugar pyrophosphorylase family protein